MRNRKRARTGSVPLVFVWIGDRLPDYAGASLRGARKNWCGPIVLITEALNVPRASGVTVVSPAHWYQRDQFERFQARSRLEGDFRDSFWFRTAERLFMLHQWAVVSSITSFVAAELDVRLVDFSDRLSSLDKVGQGIFIPRASQDYAGASVMYCNSLASLYKFLCLAVEDAEHGTEMMLLAKFMDTFPAECFGLPTNLSIAAGAATEVRWDEVSPSVVGGIFDMGPIGTWLMGDDPRNSPRQPTLTRHVYPGHGGENLAQGRFSFSIRTGEVSLGIGSEMAKPILALHVHSKLMLISHNRLALWMVVLMSRSTRPLIVVPQHFRPYIANKMTRVIDNVYLKVKPKLGQIRPKPRD